jgi:ssRNA-specific RNase YbeY (16S rRNA maturation enzyme)
MFRGGNGALHLNYYDEEDEDEDDEESEDEDDIQQENVFNQ